MMVLVKEIRHKTRHDVFTTSKRECYWGWDCNGVLTAWSIGEDMEERQVGAFRAAGIQRFINRRLFSISTESKYEERFPGGLLILRPSSGDVLLRTPSADQLLRVAYTSAYIGDASGAAFNLSTAPDLVKLMKKSSMNGVYEEIIETVDQLAYRVDSGPAAHQRVVTLEL